MLFDADGSDYTQINPHGYVPAVVLDDGTLLTESAAIIDWIAGQSKAFYPKGNSDEPGICRCSRIFRPKSRSRSSHSSS